MEVLGPGPVLPDQIRANHLPLGIGEQAAVGLVVKNQLRQRRDDPGIDEAGHDSQDQRQHHRRAQVLRPKSIHLMFPFLLLASRLSA